jgi:hypothetical protein
MINRDWRSWDGSVHEHRYRIFRDEEKMTIREYIVTNCIPLKIISWTRYSRMWLHRHTSRSYRGIMENCSAVLNPSLAADRSTYFGNVIVGLFRRSRQYQRSIKHSHEFSFVGRCINRIESRYCMSYENFPWSDDYLIIIGKFQFRHCIDV